MGQLAMVNYSFQINATIFILYAANAADILRPPSSIQRHWLTNQCMLVELPLRNVMANVLNRSNWIWLIFMCDCK